jgi:5-methylcytosine-specific restriction endonuclease McrA
MCEAEGVTRAGNVVDHITPIVVDASRRLDATNLRTLCTDHHAQVTTRFKMTGVNELPEVKQ